jgi:hypothetical protein
METASLLEMYRRILDSIHRLGNIFQQVHINGNRMPEFEGRMDAYKLIALLASDLRRTPVEETHTMANKRKFPPTMRYWISVLANKWATWKMSRTLKGKPRPKWLK